MRDLVAKPSFLLRKKLDNALHALFPRWWIPLYTSVTFSREGWDFLRGHFATHSERKPRPSKF